MQIQNKLLRNDESSSSLEEFLPQRWLSQTKQIKGNKLIVVVLQICKWARCPPVVCVNAVASIDTIAGIDAVAGVAVVVVALV